ncbi:hypothetical protein LTR91_010848 [Friedmanniomyces endolithicus]|uniref:Uncharacterized protein n=1 Tax=Friedmanniomyces endolithicus TaxID=329885 RepID=A0AAN6KIM3_9PEZI|nr:hypothetical protein LTR57_022271 [Friedmanniomyces endolithicus]KAK0984605.1 hypothetical protein LTR91_010848 [Friedmanniomyces endolithicus]KAK1030900.1 hypothetical protein LTS16_018478 [Friedmanniomyces endolithicus]
MAQAIHAASESLYYEATNASNYAGVHIESPVAAGFLHSRAVWALGLLVALAITRMITSKPKMPAGTKALPQIPESDKIARDLLVHRGKKYGGRHEIPAAVGVKDGSEFVPLMNIGDNFWRHKNLIHALNRQANADNIFFGYPELENKNTLRRLLDHPDKWSEHIITHCSRVAGRIAWGDPRHGTKLLHVVPVLLKAVSPGGPIVNLLTPLMYLPDSISPWKKAEAKRAQQMKDAFYEAQEDVIKRYEEGTAEGSWTKLWLDKAQGLEKSHLNKHEAAHAVGSNALVAIVTIGSPVHTFFTAMCHYPSWLPRLQEEVDRVCGDRLPLMTDMPELPVLRAVVKETLRWRQPTPLGVPHILEEDDVYEGYFMPKGAMIHANHYLISREPTQFPEADEWRPERWLDPSWPTYKEPLSEFPTVRGDPGFGYGVRACPGIDLVATELYTTIGSIAWGFNIKRKEGKAGYENPVPWYQTNPYVITMASQFPADVTPRTAEKARIIRQLTEDPSLTVRAVGEKSEGQFGRWDVFRPEEGSGRTFDWEGLTALAPDHDKGPRRYPVGV